MWLGKQLSRRAREDEADTGTVTASGEQLCAITDGEKRRLRVFSPGGYRWQPRAGQQVLVLKNGAVCGAWQDETETGLEPGEVELFGPDGASLRLERAGRLVLKGNILIEGAVTLTGDLTVSGTVSCRELLVNGQPVG